MPVYMIYNSLILLQMNYSLLAWGANCHSIELLQKKGSSSYKFQISRSHGANIKRHGSAETS